MAPLNSALLLWLSQLQPFKYLPPEERKRFVESVHEKSLSKGSTLFHEGEKSDSVWLLRKGRIHLNKFLHGGQVSTTCVIAEGELFCCLPALDHQTYPVNATAAADSVVIRIPSPTFSAWMQNYPSFSQETLCTFCTRLREVECHGCRIYDSVENRVAQVLLTLSRKFGKTIPLTRQEVAELAGTTLETTIRTLSRMKEKRLIRSSRGQITLLDSKLLEETLKC